MSSTQTTKISTINHDEISQFNKDSDKWWDETGPFAPLHKMNPTRMGYIKDQILQHYSKTSLQGISILDVGCGGGLACEPLARLGGDITGIDADPQAVSVATSHANAAGLSITYKNQSVEDITEQYDVVLALEIIEHVNTPQDFVTLCKNVLKPGGLLIMSTLNRTPQSFLNAIIGAEYILRWVPAGTHDWKKFIKPSEMARMMRRAGLTESGLTGIDYCPVKDTFSLHSSNLSTNYVLSATYPIR